MNKVIEMSPELWDRLARPWLYPCAEPTVKFPDIQTKVLPNGGILVHNVDLDEEAILEALKEKEQWNIQKNIIESYNGLNIGLNGRLIYIINVLVFQLTQRN